MAVIGKLIAKQIDQTMKGSNTTYTITEVLDKGKTVTKIGNIEFFFLTNPPSENLKFPKAKH